jgi:hypothetical protein
MTRPPRTIRPPPGFPPVADVVDPEHGPDEVPPCPGLDPPGSVYLVGVERETWVSTWCRGADVVGWAFVAPAGRVVDGRTATRELLRRGARLMRLAPSWGPPRERADVGSPLVAAQHTCERCGQPAEWLTPLDYRCPPCNFRGTVGRETQAVQLGLFGRAA